MNVQHLTRAAIAVAAGAILSGAAVAQDMPMPKPGPEHKLFDMDAGTWDATVETFMAPGAPPKSRAKARRPTRSDAAGCA